MIVLAPGNDRLIADVRYEMAQAGWALRRPGLNAEQARVKFVGDADVHVMRMPSGAIFHGPRAWLNTDEFGPVWLRDIEWLEFPAIAEWERPSPGRIGRVPSRKVPQDLDRIEAALARVGRFPLERTDDALRVVGHVVRGPLRRSRKRAIEWQALQRRKARS